MDILDACQTVRAWAEVFSSVQTHSTPSNRPQAVAVVKAYLEREKADGKAICELEIGEHLLMTREGMRWVLPFVLSAESMETSKCGAQAGTTGA